jgi:crotonobetainyl-CoA:carnitine CoA-transferase CaiB-like acyl-CoA transferase
VDLSSLWAGPLCAHLLGLAGARVVKVESPARPDGARAGKAEFFALLNAGKASVALDLASRGGGDRLRRLLARADVVVESARPRALRQLGIEAEAEVGARPGLVWVGITGYGRSGSGANWVAYGDDAAVAAGLAAATGEPEGTPLFCGDAIADPLAGIHAAAAALAALRAGDAVLLDVPLCDVTAAAARSAEAARDARVRSVDGGFEVVAGGLAAPVLPPRARKARGVARPLGADTASVLRELGC